ncbi:MAG TPA: histidine phosphatase family protein [Steroidobacteraceae bacterium]|nr:histidine phosphatase family protein [Steroidobacteraceae bacterium]
MARIYLVRHGEATAHWTEATDPGLSEIGLQQAHATAKRLAPLGPLAIASSPLRRARETAAPLEAAWRTTARIVEAVAELPTPRMRLDERPLWLQKVMHGGWSAADRALLQWRHAVLDFLTACEQDIVVFSHFVAINVALGAALGRDEFAPFKPANASITVLANDDGRLQLIEHGAAMREA